ncbi:DUF6084 family protein [Goodfellowiella coeruleoviolacea]|uniref:Uncharacterized protein n=1 Tax=Goodfellowiella coeruleoviolacea TaxID=334858 RepID=A0AAE3G873_9PSEU|nr:DUF6084 family protein [Goodfellowiella coeruleoviolacea]MCP2163501.1 hypothetical protein [Goodfellowiella coeruleoviolacea]
MSTANRSADRAAAPDLAFTVVDVVAQAFAAVPTLDVRVRVERMSGGPVQSVLLHTAVAIAAARRGYDEPTQRRLVELFGAPELWDRTLRSLVWHRSTAVVPAFTDSTLVTVALACSSDFELATTKYLHAVRDGDVVLELSFSGTVFHSTVDGGLRAAQLPWHQQASTAFPVGVWRRLVERYYGTSRWIRLGPDTFDRLAAYRAAHALPSWDSTVDALVLGAREGAPGWTR